MTEGPAIPSSSFARLFPDEPHYGPQVPEQRPHHPVTNPRHYTYGNIETVDFIIDKELNFCLGEVVKYVVRAGKKDPKAHLEDLKKAEYYLQREMRRLSDAAADY